MSKSDFLENAIINRIFEGTSFPSIPGTWVSLHAGDPGETGANEVSGNGYARVQVAQGSGWTSFSGSVTNAGVISFPTSTGAWGTITHIGIWTASTGGNPLYFGDLVPDIVVGASGFDFDIEAGAIVITEE